MSDVLASLQEFVHGGIRWRVLPGWEDRLFGAGGLRLDEWLGDGRAQVVKHGPHRTVYRVAWPGLSIYLKHYRLADFRSWLRELVRPPKAWLEFQRALAVAGRQVPTAAAVAVGERAHRPGESFLITQGLENVEPLREFIEETLPQASSARRGRLQQHLAKALGTFVASLHQSGIVHQDLHAANILSVQDYLAWSGVAGLAPTTPAVATVLAPSCLEAVTFPIQGVLRGFYPADFFLRFKDFGPPGAPIMAVRLARQAVASQPDQADPYFSLAQAYEALWRLQEERWLGGNFNLDALTSRQHVRQVQLASALEYALRQRPGEPRFQSSLAGLYLQMNFLDLAMEHLSAAIDAYIEIGPEGNESMDAFRQKLDGLQKQLKGLQDEVQRRQSRLDSEMGNQPAFARAQMSFAAGLPKKAYDIIQTMDVSQLQDHEAQFIFALLLSIGRPDEVEDALREEYKSRPELNYDWLKVLTGAALGKYKQAGRHLDDMIADMDQKFARGSLQAMRRMTVEGADLSTLQATTTLVDLARKAADLRTLRGLLCLESGDVAAAATFFEEALQGSGGAELAFEGKPIAARYLELIRAARK